MLTTRFAHIHIPRTGGSTLRTFLEDIPGATVISPTAHLPYSTMKEICTNQGQAMPPAFAFIRHPCSWYVSQWRWFGQIDQGGLGGATFVEFMEVVKSGVPRVSNPLAVTWRYLGADSCQYIGRFENYQDEVVRILGTIIPDLITEEEIRAKIQMAGHVRQALQPGENWQQHYDAKWLAQVMEWDGRLMKRFGYKI